MNDSKFYCIVDHRSRYYLGFFKGDCNGYLLPATSTCISEALKFIFAEEARTIAKALCDKRWRVKQVSV